MEITEWRKDDYLLTTERSKIDPDAVHDFLSGSYWAKNIPLTTVQKSIANSFCFGLIHQDKLIGFARVISDFATFAYLADVFIVPGERGKGLSKWLISVILDHPRLQGLRRFLLATKDAHRLYSKFGFAPLDEPGRWMVKYNPDVYVLKTRN